MLPVVRSCRDLGVLLSNDLSPSNHMDEIARKGQRRANTILRCFVTRYSALLVHAFVCYVLPTAGVQQCSVVTMFET